MNNELIRTIKSIPPLPDNITDLEEFKKLNNEDVDTLTEIINRDPLMTATVLRVANSTMFGFRSEIETVNKAINLLGINFTISIAIGSAIQNSVKSNLSAYGVTNEDFLFSSMLATKLVNSWVASIDNNLLKDLVLPAFLQDIGKFVISQVIQNKKLTNDFLKRLSEIHDLSKIEIEFVGYSTSRITANIFKHWSLSHKLILPIAFVENIENCPETFLKQSQILHIIKILTTVTEPLSENMIELASQKALEYGFDVENLKFCVNAIKKKIEI